ncbi:hypothetical protein [Azoarcus olearius]|uniref:hypothetical protein n=1 Tax=Azoarcus sp. (strain BH72) TaxID=418699 RepID=UPI0013051B80|nr:hypothetical protein [Azoarcus olearius]
MDATTVAVDLAKHVFQLAVADLSWRVVDSPFSLTLAPRLIAHHGKPGHTHATERR